MVSKIEWHPAAFDDVARIGEADRRRIRDALADLAKLDDARLRLVPYTGSLKGYWKLRIGDYRLVCRIERRAGQTIIVIHLAHRSVVYNPRSLRTIKRRS